MSKRSEGEGPNPSGLCQCGCGETAPLAAYSDKNRGYIVGKPLRFCRGHQFRGARREIPLPNPSGLCMCGCGQKTNPAPYTNEARGYVKGEPMRYIRGHKGRKGSPEFFEGPGPNPSGICQCGCGGVAPPAPYSDAKRGYVVGKPLRFIQGHGRRGWRAPLRYEVEDRGYIPEGESQVSPCWIWQGGFSNTGYGRAGGKSAGAHCAAYERWVGPIPKGLVLHHWCEQYDCIRPEHLSPMTRSDHMRLHMKHRGPSDETVEAIRAATGSQRSIAARFSVSQGLVWRIKHGQR